MLQFFVTLQTLLNDRTSRKDEGATMIEYGLMVALIALVVAVGAATLGTTTDGLFDKVTTKLGGTAT